MVMRTEIPSLTFQGNLYEQHLLPMMREEWDKVDVQMMAEGPTGTGKTVEILAGHRYIMRKYPGCHILAMRRYKEDLQGSFMQTWEDEVLDWSDPWDRWMLTGGSRRVMSRRARPWYRYPNGSVLWMRGMDDWSRIKSMAFDVIHPMEMTEFTEDQIEGLFTRLRARLDPRTKEPMWFPKRFMIGDVNPDHPKHWANQRAMRLDKHGEPLLKRIKTTLKDNPGYWNRAKQEWTEAGKEYRANLRRMLSGPNYSRYVNGVWSAGTGQILNWDESVHVLKGTVTKERGGRWTINLHSPHPHLGSSVELIGFGASYDHGKRHAGTLQIWGLDKKGRMYLVEEVYHSQRPLRWWAEWVVKYWRKYALQFVVCESAIGGTDAMDRFNERLAEEAGYRAGIVEPCMKRTSNRSESNMEVLVDLFSPQADGAPGVFIMDNALAHAPDVQVTAHCLADEIPGYVYAEHDIGRLKGRPEDRPDKGCVDDGLDACVYARVHMLGGRRVIDKGVPVDTSKSLHEKMTAKYWAEAGAA